MLHLLPGQIPLASLIMCNQVETDKEYNTLFPKWNDLPKPLYYNGTWSELQNEIMMVRVIKPCQTAIYI